MVSLICGCSSAVERSPVTGEVVGSTPISRAVKMPERAIFIYAPNCYNFIYMKQARRGFSLIEIIISVSILAIIGFFLADAFINFKDQQIFSSARNIISSSLRYAQQISMANASNTPWGVKILPGQVVVFGGTSYSSRDISKDKIVEISGAISLSGDSEFVFSRDGGKTSPGSINILHKDTSMIIIINSDGLIYYN